MIIETPDGKHISQITTDEKKADLYKRWKSMSDEEKRVVMSVLDEIDFISGDFDTFENIDEVRGYSPTIHTIASHHYSGEIVSIREFVKNPYYLGHVGSYFWPKWLDDMEDVFSGRYTEIIVTGSIGSGKTVFSDMCLSYVFYELCMLEDPQATFGLMPGSEIVLVCFNRDKKLARDVTFGGLKRKLEPSPFFRDLGVKFGNSEIHYAGKNIRIIAASVRSADALGRDVFGGIIDETEFMEGSVLRQSGGIQGAQKPFAELLHESVTRRMKSRYDRAGVLPGKLFLASSARDKDSFTNRRIGEAANDPRVFCRDYAIYDVAPRERFSSKRFWVLVGNERIRHKILTRAEYRAMGKDGRDKFIENGCRFIKVPDNFRGDFERNIEDAIRDISGVVTVSLSPFIQMRDKIYEAIDPDNSFIAVRSPDPV